jgi:hypothetical protein
MLGEQSNRSLTGSMNSGQKENRVKHKGKKNKGKKRTKDTRISEVS